MPIKWRGIVVDRVDGRTLYFARKARDKKRRALLDAKKFLFRTFGFRRAAQLIDRGEIHVYAKPLKGDKRA